MPPLRIGMVGDDVTSLQLALVAVGLLAGDPTGAFDTTTQRGVVEMQRRAGLAQTGVMDDASWNALYQMQASVAPSPGAPIVGDTQYVTGTAPGAQTPGRGLLLAIGAAAGLAYWFTHKHQLAEYDEDEDDDERDDDEEDEEEEEEEFEQGARGARMSDLDDVVTDSLINEPARYASSGRASDCKKAAMLLMRRAGLAQRPSERALYDKTVRKVAADCRGAEEAIEEAIEEEQERRAEIESEVGAKLIRSPLDTARAPAEQGFRKTKFKLTRKSTGSERSEKGTRGRGRRGSAAVEVRRGGKPAFLMRKEKAKTKRGYTWRRE